jgi:hypothetical protein
MSFLMNPSSHTVRSPGRLPSQQTKENHVAKKKLNYPPGGIAMDKETFDQHLAGITR